MSLAATRSHAQAPSSPKVEGDLAAARGAIERILRNESEIAAETELAEATLRAAEAQAKAAMAAELQAIDALHEAEAEEARASADLAEREAALGGRLRARYRLLRSGVPGEAVVADSPAALGRQRRALDRVLQADLVLVRLAQEAAKTLAALRSEREAALVGLEERTREAKAAVEEARAASKARETLLASLRSERALHEQRIRELGQAQARLTEEIDRIAESGNGSQSNAFARLRGQLPWPVEDAVVEVLFGKMLNARFKTVVAQNGLDLRAPHGAEVTAVAPGRVIFADWFRAYGNLVIVDHGGGYHTLYGHLDTIDLPVGATLEAGDLVGLLGDSGSLKGSYLYFELRENGKPIDPFRWFRQR